MNGRSAELVLFVEPIIFSNGTERLDKLELYKLKLYELKLRQLTLGRQVVRFLDVLEQQIAQFWQTSEIDPQEDLEKQTDELLNALTREQETSGNSSETEMINITNFLISLRQILLIIINFLRSLRQKLQTGQVIFNKPKPIEQNFLAEIRKLSKFLSNKRDSLTLFDLMVVIRKLLTDSNIFQQFKNTGLIDVQGLWQHHFQNDGSKKLELTDIPQAFYAEAEEILLETIKILYQFYFPQEGQELFEYRRKTKEELRRILTKNYGHVEIPFVWQLAALIQDLPFVIDPQKFKQDAEMILKIFETLMPLREFYKALAIAHGASLIDKIAEEVRHIGVADSNLVVGTSDRQVPKNVAKALSGDTSVAEDPETWAAVCGYTPPFVEMEKLLHVVQDHDLESIILAGLKLGDKIRAVVNQLVSGIKLSAKEKISAYQDCMAMLHLYGPLVDLAGFRDLANEFTSAALEFLNRQILPEEIISGLEKTYKIGEQIYNKAVLVGEGMSQPPQTAHQGLGLILVEAASSLVIEIFGRSAVIIGDTNLNLDTFARRLKSFGSFLSKLTKPLKKDPKQFDSGRIDLNIGTPDQIGVKVVIPADTSNQDTSNQKNASEDAYRQKVADLVSKLILTIINLQLVLPTSSEDEDNKDYKDYEDTKTVLRCAVKHTRGEPPISFINFNEKEFEAIKAKIQERFPEIDVSHETRETGYTAIHLNAVVQVDGAEIGVEIQIVRETDNLNNTYGLFSHAAYKAGINTHTDSDIQTLFMTVSIGLAKRHKEFYDALRTGLLAEVELCSSSASRLHTKYGVPLNELPLDCFQ